MSEIRPNRPAAKGSIEFCMPKDVDCVFCHEVPLAGAYWRGPVDLAVCRQCVLQGELGKLIGDALDTHDEIVRALTATELNAYRSRLLATERARHRSESPLL